MPRCGVAGAGQVESGRHNLSTTFLAATDDFCAAAREATAEDAPWGEARNKHDFGDGLRLHAAMRAGTSPGWKAAELPIPAHVVSGDTVRSASGREYQCSSGYC